MKASTIPPFVIQGEAMQRLRRRLADAGRSPTLEVRLDGEGVTLRVLKENGDVVQKDDADGWVHG